MVQKVSCDKVNREELPKREKWFFIVIFNTESNDSLFYKEEKGQVQYRTYE